jgi:hypothetical protein
MHCHSRIVSSRVGVIFGCLLMLPWLAVGAQTEQDSRAKFTRAFEHAFTSKDIAATLDLFYWHGVPLASRDVIVALIKRDLSFTLAQTTWLELEGLELDPDEPEPGEIQANLKTFARFAARFTSPAGQEHISLHAIGRHAGKYYIALFTRVSAPARAI